MPARRRRPRRRRDEGLVLMPPGRDQDLRSEGLLDCMLHGDAAFSMLLDDDAGFDSEADEKAAWEINREMVMSLHLRDPIAPGVGYLAGNRPWAWWKYEAYVGPEIWGDRERFRPGWRRWEFDYLKEHDLLRLGEEEEARRLCAKILASPSLRMEDLDKELAGADLRDYRLGKRAEYML